MPKARLNPTDLLRRWEELLREGPHEDTRWRHLKSGATDVVLALCLREVDHMPQVVYRRSGSETAVWWVRPLAQFLLKFEALEREVIGD